MFYAVDKALNDQWLEDDCPIYTYENRPWAKSFRSLHLALKYANDLPNKDTVEIETPTGEVLAYENGVWTVVFT